MPKMPFFRLPSGSGRISAGAGLDDAAGNLEYGHDLSGNVEMITAWNETVTYSDTHYRYDSRNRLSRVEDRFGVTGRVISYGYSADGNSRTTSLPNGVRTTYDLTLANRLWRVAARRNDVLIADFTYELGLGGHREKLTEQIGINPLGRADDRKKRLELAAARASSHATQNPTLYLS